MCVSVLLPLNGVQFRHVMETLTTGEESLCEALRAGTGAVRTLWHICAVVGSQNGTGYYDGA